MRVMTVQFCGSKEFPLSLLAGVEYVEWVLMTEVGIVVRFRGSKGFPSLLSVEVLTKVVKIVRFRNSKGFPSLLLVEVE